MKKEIIGILICTLLIAATNLTVAGDNEKISILDKNLPNTIPKIRAEYSNKNFIFQPSSLDLAVTNYDTDQVGIFIGDGIGGFSNLGNSPVGPNPLAINGGDFNGDDNFDLVASNFAANYVTVLLGDGAGGFTTSGDFTVGTFPFSLVTEDFDEDNNLDVAVVNMNSDNISILFGDGTGSFAPQQIYTVGLDPTDLVADDFNNDNHCDLIVISENDPKLTIMLGDGSGGFSYLNPILLDAEYTSYCMTKEDFNEDGNLDLAIGSSSHPYVGVLLGDGAGGFGSITSFTVGLGGERFDIITDDFNNDGNKDIALPNTDENTISVLYGDGTGSFGTHQVHGAGIYPVGIVSGDFNHDDNSDLAVTNAFDNTISIYLNDGTGGFGPEQNFSGGDVPAGIITADFNYEPQDDLSCSGDLNWDDVAPGSTVESSFIVENIGEEGSLLNWEIESYPEWGTWTFIPDSGTDLLAGESITVEVEIVAPDEENTEFTGEIKILNSDYPSDFCIIDVILKTPLVQTYQFTFLQLLLEKLPNAYQILRYIFGL